MFGTCLEQKLCILLLDATVDQEAPSSTPPPPNTLPPAPSSASHASTKIKDNKPNLAEAQQAPPPED